MRRGLNGESPDSGKSGIGGCPFHNVSGTVSPEQFGAWRDNQVYCSAGKREFQLGRYMVEHVRNGYQFSDAMGRFAEAVGRHAKTGFLAIVPSEEGDFADSVGELRRLGEIMVDAGYADSAGALVSGETVAIPFEIECPVTGIFTTYEFFPVAFCRHAATVVDPLYDPSLSTPFLAINTTSDAFAFGMLVKDLCERHFQCAPHQLAARHDLERLLHRCVNVWQNMSINTITSYNKVAEIARRAVHLSEDRRSWIAPHNDPVFAEMVKETHSHEMPVVYAARLAEKWMSALFDGAEYRPGRDGQSGGMFVAPQDLENFAEFDWRQR